MARDFGTIVGEQNVLTGAHAAARATFATSQTVKAVVRPASTTEVAECVRLARELKAPLYPISRGRNLGYGSAVPVVSGCIILDLSRMNRILEVDEELAYAVVEPGVTYEQLHDHLKSIGSELFASVGGAVPDASLVGNALERGIGRGPNGDRSMALCNLQVVLGTGDIVETGLDRFPSAKAGNVWRGSVGPTIDGLFIQSNFGITTRMTVWLSRAPEHLQTVFFRIESPDRLVKLVDAIRELRMRGVFRAPLLMSNAYRLLSFEHQYPWAETGGRTPLPQEVFAEMCKRNDVPAWGGDAALYCHTAREAEAAREHVEEILGPHVDRLDFMTDAQSTGDARRGWRDMHLGVPNAKSLKPTYWRKTKPPVLDDMDPDRDGVGILWYAPTVPARARDVSAVVTAAEEIALRHGFEPNLGFQFVTERSAVMTGALFYDRLVTGADEQAMACYHALRARLDGEGYYPYRMSIASMGSLPANVTFDRLQEALKLACDPDDILAPGRYEPKGA